MSIHYDVPTPDNGHPNLSAMFAIWEIPVSCALHVKKLNWYQSNNCHRENIKCYRTLGFMLLDFRGARHSEMGSPTRKISNMDPSVPIPSKIYSHFVIFS